jgi:Flp pilus assembly protein TadG
MTWTLSDSGTTSALNVASGETTLATDTNNGTFVLEVDTSNIVNGDLLEIRIYTITLSGGTLTQVWKGTYQHAQINNHKVSPAIASDQSIKCTVKLLAVASGTRTFDWKMLRI